MGDFIKQDLPYFDVCISNTPYQVRMQLQARLTPQISSPLVFKLLSQRPLPRVAVLMFQREFAMRLVARPGDALWCRLSANVQLYARVQHVLKGASSHWGADADRLVSKNNFRPPPQVESSVVRLEPLDPPPPIAFDEFDGLTRIVFSRRNKTVRANFGAKGVREMLEANAKTARAVRTDLAADEVFDASVAIDEVLDASGYADQRAAKMDVTDFLELLAAFHKRDFHFAA